MILLGLLAACAPGILQTPEGSEPLRTALWSPDPGAPEETATLLLSNGSLPCADFSDADDATAVDRIDLKYALCREGARHVFLQLRKTADRPWAGTWSEATASMLWIAIHDTEVVVDGPGDAFDTLAIVDADFTPVTDAFQVELDPERRGTLEAAFLPLSSRFRAEECPATAPTATAIFTAPVFSCE